MDRRQLLARLGAVSCFALPFQARAAQALHKKVKITDVKVMIVRGPTWDWNLIKVETDAAACMASARPAGKPRRQGHDPQAAQG